MKVPYKVPELLKKAVTAFRSRTSALRARLLILASVRRRAAMVGEVSRRIHALVAGQEKARVEHGRAALAAADVDDVIDLSELALFQEDDDGFLDWTHSLFDDDNDDGDENDDEYRDDSDEPSVIDMIRSSRESEGVEFKIEDEIDEAADMFIRRCRRRMNRSF